MNRIIPIGICVFFASAAFAHAQVSLTGLEQQLSLTLAPTHPGPNQTVQLSIQTFAVDLERTMVVWYANDKEIARGIGRTEATITAGASGEETYILVVAQDGVEIVAAAEAFIRPAEVDILWEALSYTPPFYGGRPLPGASSPIRAYAFARFQKSDGTMVPESDIIYSWHQNGAVAQRGRGKSSVTLPGPSLFGADSLKVVAESADRSFSGEASVRVASVDPFALLYENHPLFGILYHRALVGSVNTLENEQKVTAVPYFAGISSPGEPSLAYAWEVNGGAIVPDPREPQTLTVTAEGYTGPASIALDLTSFADILLHATAQVELIFGERGNSFFSTLNPFGSGE